MSHMLSKAQKKWLWIVPALLVVAVAVAWEFMPLREWIVTFQQWVRSLGAVGYLLFFAIYVLGSLLVMPSMPFTVVAGVAFDGWGVPLVLVSATVGAALAFLIARYLARERLKALIKGKPRFQAVDKAVTEEGWKVVLLLRLSPLVPFNVQNYLFGLTDVRLKPYLAATVVGILPGTMKAVYLGALGGGGSDPLTWGLFILGWLAGLIAIVVIARRAQAKLHPHRK
jgi:uncharacterized membrane protein YdjX (TVP38/TMEM64 family)